MKYEGEIDKDGKACGVGIVSLAKDPNQCIEGTFYKNKRYGYCESLKQIHQSVFVGCSKNLDDGWINWSYHKADDRHGKGTDYMT